MADPDPRPERALLLVGLGATIALIAWGCQWCVGADAPWLSTIDAVFAGGCGLAAAVSAYAIVRGQVRLRVHVAAIMALAPLLFYIADRQGYGLGQEVWESQRIALLCVGACTIGAVGLVLRKSWARWLALAFAACGLGTSGLNLIRHLGEPSLVAWIYIIVVSYSAVVGLALVGPSVRAQFESEGADGVWSSREPTVRAIRWSVISQLVAIPMLLVYAWIQPIVPETQTVAVVLAGVLGVGAGLAMARKIVGALLLGLAGPGLLVLTAVSAWLSTPETLSIVGYYACFWVPAGIISMVCGVVLARPIWRLWRGLSES